MGDVGNNDVLTLIKVLTADTRSGSLRTITFLKVGPYWLIFLDDMLLTSSRYTRKISDLNVHAQVDSEKYKT